MEPAAAAAAARATAPVHSTLPPPPPPPPPPQPETSPFGDFLRALHLLPPTGEGSGEVQVGAWWATRIGALLAVIAGVFFGVYVSMGTAPWVKLAELALVSVGVTFLGRWIERRAARTGVVVESAGLALIFFTAFAAYAVPPVKVIDNVALAAAAQAAQAAAVALIFWAAVRRDSSTVATMATLLGFVSAFFSVAGGFDDFAVIAALTLTVVTVVFRRWRGWAMPLGMAAVLVHIVYVSVALSVWDTETGARSIWFVFGVLAAGFGAVLASLVIEGPDEAGHFARAQRWVQTLNTALAALVGFAATVALLPDEFIARYLFAAGAVLAFVATWAWRAAPGDGLGSMFAVKAAALIALGVVAEWGERTRWVALFIEAVVLLAAARRTGKLVLYLTAVLAWAVSTLFFVDDVGALRGFMLSGAGATVFAYALGVAWFFALLVRWWPGASSDERSWSGIGIGLAAAPATVAAGWLVFGEAWGPVAVLGLAVALGGMARVMRTWLPTTPAAVALVMGHIMLHVFHASAHGMVWLWTNAAALALITALIGWYAADVRARRTETHELEWTSGGIVLLTMGVVAIATGLFQSLESRLALGATLSIAAVLAWIGSGSSRASLLATGAVSAAFGVVLFPIHSGDSFLAPGSVAWLWLAACAAFATMVAWGRAGPARTAILSSPWRIPGGALAAFAGVMLSWIAPEAALSEAAAEWCILGFAVAYFALGLWQRAGWSMTAACAVLALIMFGVGVGAMSRTWPGDEQAWWKMGAAFATAIAFAAAPVVAGRFARWIKRATISPWRILQVTIAMLFIVFVALRQPAPWASLASVILALGGVTLFLLGLFLRARSHRLAGLVLLLACIPRVFLVDITSTLYRIAAFAVLGGVLIWVGVSYQRFRHLVESENEAPEPDAAPGSQA